MSPKRPPSKQRRQSQNRANRAALEKRRQNVATGGAPAATTSGTAKPAASTSSSGGSFLSRLTGGGAASSATQVPTGYRAALTAVFLAVVGVIFAATLQAPIDAQGEMIRTREDQTASWSWTALEAAHEDPEASAEALVDDVDWAPDTERYLTAAFPMSLAIVLPLLATGLAFWVVRKGATSRVVNRCMYVTLFGSLLVGMPLTIMFLPAAIAVGVAGFQLKKEEVAAVQAAQGDGDGVIDVEEVDEPDDVDAPEAGAVDEVDAATEADEVEVEIDEVEADDEPAAPRAKAGGGLQLTNRPDED